MKYFEPTFGVALTGERMDEGKLGAFLLRQRELSS